MVAGGVAGGVELRHMDGDGIGGCELAYEGFVAVAVAGAQVEVAMGYGKGVSGGVHEMGEYHGVDAPTNGEQHLLPGGEEVLLPDVCYECL